MEYLSTFLTVALFTALGTATYTGLTGGAPTIPTRRRERRDIIELAELPSNQPLTFCDLGSGSGRLLFEIAQQYPKCRCVGVEFSLVPYLYSQFRKLLSGQKYHQLSFKFRDMYRYDISEADIVFTFQIPGCYDKLQRKFTAELSDQARLIIEAWPFEDIEPLARIKSERSLPLYLYRGSQFRE